MYKELYDIPGFKNWRVIKKVNEGWSSDLKFYIEDYEGNKLLLRVNDISNYDNKIKEFKFIKKCNVLDFSMSQALEIGICNNNSNVYMILTWVEGFPLNNVIGNLNKNEQYKLGMQAGKILNEIHSLELNPSDNLICYSKKNKILDDLFTYENSMNRVKGDKFAINFVKNNIKKINSADTVCRHGDYHVGNLVLTPLNTIGVIDFNRCGYGDRYEEFQRVQSFNVEASIPFSIGQIHGYFDGNPPLDFWNVLAVYVAYNSLGSIIWAEKFGQNDIDGMKKRCLNTFNDYSNFKEIVPKWYQLHSEKYL